MSSRPWEETQACWGCPRRPGTLSSTVTHCSPRIIMYQSITPIYFVGIGGAGMSGLAEVLLNLGYQVSGSDLKLTETTERLHKRGATIFQGHHAEHVTDVD